MLKRRKGMFLITVDTYKSLQQKFQKNRNDLYFFA